MAEVAIAPLPALMEAFQNLRGKFFRSKGRVHWFQPDLPLFSDAWLIESGGIILILGLVALLSS